MEIVTYRDAFGLPIGATLTDTDGATWTVEPWAIVQYGRGIRLYMSESDEPLPHGPFTRRGTAVTSFRSVAMNEGRPLAPLPGEQWVPRSGVLVSCVHVDALYRDRDGTACVAYSFRAVPGPLTRAVHSVEAFMSLFDRREG